MNLGGARLVDQVISMLTDVRHRVAAVAIVAAAAGFPTLHDDSVAAPITIPPPVVFNRPAGDQP